MKQMIPPDTVAEPKKIRTVGQPFLDESAQTRFRARDVNVFYSGKQAIFDVGLDIGRNEVISMIGPSGCGKSTFLRCLNRMNDVIRNCSVAGDIKLEGHDIHSPDMDVVVLRARVGMVFQNPIRFPNRFLTTSPMALASMVSPTLVLSWRKSSSAVCAAPAFGTRSAIAWISQGPGCPVANSSACASPAPLPSVRRSS